VRGAGTAGLLLMYVKVLQGRFKGEVRELSNDVALDMIKLGRVGRAFQDEAAPAVVAAPAAGEAFVLVDNPPLRGPKPAKKRAGK